MEKREKDQKDIRMGRLMVVASVLLGANMLISGAGLWLAYTDSRTTQVTAESPADTVDILADLPSTDSIGQPPQEPPLVDIGRSQERIRKSLVRLRETAEERPPVADHTDADCPDAAPTSRPDFVLIEDGMTLRNLARRYYGSEVFWVCIYDYNSQRLRSPDILPLGIRLSLPRAADYDIDADDPSSLRRARALAKNLARL